MLLDHSQRDIKGLLMATATAMGTMRNQQDIPVFGVLVQRFGELPCSFGLVALQQVAIASTWLVIDAGFSITASLVGAVAIGGLGSAAGSSPIAIGKCA